MFFATSTRSAKKRFRSASICTVVAIGLLSATAFAQRPGETRQDYQSRTKWWQDARVGVSMHWGLGCKLNNDEGCQLSWRRGNNAGGNGPCVLDKCGTPANPGGARFTPKYDGNVSDFNPTALDADATVKRIKDAGFGYLVLTVKHHEGFAMWRTKQIHSKAGTGTWPAGPHAISMSDWGKADSSHDPTMLYAKACKKHKLPFGIYYSPRDWYNADYGVGDNSVYEAYMLGQLTELLNGDYGRMNVVWWDGFGRVPGKSASQMVSDRKTNAEKPKWVVNGSGDTVYDIGTHNIGEPYWHYSKVMDTVYSLAPWIVSNPRCVYYSNNSRRGMGDFDVGETGNVTSSRLSERIYGTMHGAWGWQKGGVNPFNKYVFPKMIDMITNGGNFLMNIDPKPDGTIDERQLTLIDSMGLFLEECGRAVVNTRKGPWSGGGVRSTCRNDTVFVHLIKTNNKSFSCSDAGLKVLGWEEITSGTKSVTQSGGKVNISLSSVDTRDHVIAVKVDSVLYDPTEGYDAKWDPYAWFKESNWPNTSPVANTLRASGGFLAAPKTLRVCGDAIVLPSAHAKKAVDVSLYALDGSLVKRGVVKNGRASLRRDFGVRTGVYIVRMK